MCMFQARVTVVISQDFQQIFAQYDEKAYRVKPGRRKDMCSTLLQRPLGVKL